MNDQKTATLRAKISAGFVLLLASAPITFIAARLYQYFTDEAARVSPFALYEAERFLVFLTLGLLTYAVVCKRLTGTMVTASLWCAGLASQYVNIVAWSYGARPSDMPVSTALDTTSILLPSPPLLMTCTALLVVLMCMVPFKRQRSLDRLYVISIGTFVLSTTAIFSSTLNAGLQEQLPVVSNAALDMLESAARYNEVKDQFRRMLATMSITVHAAWILATLVGLAIHKNNLARRLREQRTIDDYVEKRFYEFIQG